MARVCRPRGLRPQRALEFSRLLATRLRVEKVVVCDDRGGLGGDGRKHSFMTSGGVERLIETGADLGGWSEGELREVIAVVAEAGASVNLTTAAGLADELFTYEGAGTLVTAARYCSVDRLGVDDFDEALGLLERGEREGYLLHRDAEEKARLLLTGYGAWFEGDRMAGVASLETDLYARSRLGEIRGLYTITRFQGEGVGGRLVAHLAGVGRRRGLRALFACTSNAKAVDFFTRNGFERVHPRRLPAAKWRSRTAGAQPIPLWMDL